MRTLSPLALILLALASGGGARPAAASNEAAWCAYYEDNGGSNCGFATRQECEADISGNGGYCAPDPEAGQ
jgi:Protein of unknown function (DUF3551)